MPTLTSSLFTSLSYISLRLLSFAVPTRLAIMETPLQSVQAEPDLEASPSPELLPKKHQSTIALRWKENLDTANADLVCLLLCFLTGLCDSSAYNAWSCFLGMQTGTRRSMNHIFAVKLKH